MAIPARFAPSSACATCASCRGGGCFCVAQVHRQQHAPARLPRKHGERREVLRHDGRLRPWGREPFLQPGRALVGADAAEAHDPRPERAQQVHQIAAGRIAGDRVQVARLERQPEEVIGNDRPDRRLRIDGDVEGLIALALCRRRHPFRSGRPARGPGAARERGRQRPERHRGEGRAHEGEHCAAPSGRSIRCEHTCIVTVAADGRRSGSESGPRAEASVPARPVAWL